MKGIVRNLRCEAIVPGAGVGDECPLNFLPGFRKIADEVCTIVNKGGPRSYRQSKAQTLLTSHPLTVLGNRWEEVSDFITKHGYEIIQRKQVRPESMLVFIVI